MTYLAELTTGGSQILKTDSRGRVRVSQQRREVLLDEFEKSGMTARAFARMVGVHPTTFAAWHLRRRKAGDAGNATAGKGLAPVVRLVEAVSMEQEQESKGLRVEVAGIAWMEIEHESQVAWAAQLIAGLSKRG